MSYLVRCRQIFTFNDFHLVHWAKVPFKDPFGRWQNNINCLSFSYVSFIKFSIQDTIPPFSYISVLYLIKHVLLKIFLMAGRHLLSFSFYFTSIIDKTSSFSKHLVKDSQILILNLFSSDIDKNCNKIRLRRSKRIFIYLMFLSSNWTVKPISLSE